jgi:allantoinase
MISAAAAAAAAVQPVPPPTARPRAASRALATLAAVAAAALAVYLARGPAAATAAPPRFPPPPFVLCSSRVALPGGRVAAADVVVDAAGVIGAVVEGGRGEGATSRVPVVDVTPLLVMPGLVDPHVHVNEPGRTAWEGFDSATRAAAAGGTTAILDMPLNGVPATVTMAALAAKAAALAEARLAVDVGLIAGIIPGNIEALASMAAAGVLAFKSFMVDSQSADFPPVGLDDLAAAMAALAALAPDDPDAFFPPYILHAELPPDGHDAAAPYPGDPASYPHYLASRPDAWETDAVAAALRVAAATRCRIHFAHVSSADAADAIAAHAAAAGPAAARGVTAETCSQYLAWAAEDIPDAAPQYKCAPPIRSAANRARLWRHVGRTLSIVASDHSPADPALKRVAAGDVRGAWGGISGLQYRLQATWTAALALDAGETPVDALVARVADALAGAPARTFGLRAVKGAIAPGGDADFVVWDPAASAVVREDGCLHRHKLSPFVGMNLTGVVHWTLLRGRVVFAADPADADTRPEAGAGGRVLAHAAAAAGGGDDGRDPSGGVLALAPADFAAGLQRHL